MKNKIKLNFQNIINSIKDIEKKKYIYNKIKTIIIICLIIIFFIPLLVIIIINSFTRTYINKNIKIVEQNKSKQSKEENKQITTNKIEESLQKEREKDQEKEKEKNSNIEKEQSVLKKEIQSNNITNHQKETYIQKPIEEPLGNITEMEVFNSINKFRTSLGLSSLLWDNSIYSYAKVRVNEIISTYSHIRPNGQSSLLSAPVPIHAENLAYGQTSANEIFSDWKDSSEHYQNIINSSYTKCAVSNIIKDGVYYWVFLVF